MKGFSLCLALHRAAVKVFCARDSDSVLSGPAQSTRAAELRQRRVETLAAPDTETYEGKHATGCTWEETKACREDGTIGGQTDRGRHISIGRHTDSGGRERQMRERGR